jgi:hypothetical protein
MSDGPHRSLNMTRSWKRVAERSDKRSYSREEVSESFVGALEKDCRREINTAFIDTAWRIFSDPEPSLFVTKISDQLELSRSLGIPEPDVQRKLERLLSQHENEWKEFVHSLGKNSFVAKWAIHASL